MVVLYLVAGFVCSFSAAAMSISLEWGILATLASYCVGGMVGMTLIAFWGFLSSLVISKPVTGVLAVDGKRSQG